LLRSREADRFREPDRFRDRLRLLSREADRDFAGDLAAEALRSRFVSGVLDRRGDRDRLYEGDRRRRPPDRERDRRPRERLRERLPRDRERDRLKCVLEKEEDKNDPI